MSGLYKKYKEACLSGDGSHASHVQPLVDTIKLMLVDSGYVADLAAHQFKSDVGGGNIVAISPALSGKSIANGTFDADDIDFSGVSGSTVTQTILFKDTGVDATSPLMLWVNAATGLPDVPNGAPVVYQVDPGADALFIL